MSSAMNPGNKIQREKALNLNLKALEVSHYDAGLPSKHPLLLLIELKLQSCRYIVLADCDVVLETLHPTPSALSWAAHYVII